MVPATKVWTRNERLAYSHRTTRIEHDCRCGRNAHRVHACGGTGHVITRCKPRAGSWSVMLGLADRSVPTGGGAGRPPGARGTPTPGWSPGMTARLASPGSPAGAGRAEFPHPFQPFKRTEFREGGHARDTAPGAPGARGGSARVNCPGARSRPPPVPSRPARYCRPLHGGYRAREEITRRRDRTARRDDRAARSAELRDEEPDGRRHLVEPGFDTQGDEENRSAAPAGRAVSPGPYANGRGAFRLSGLPSSCRHRPSTKPATNASAAGASRITSSSVFMSTFLSPDRVAVTLGCASPA